MSYTLDKILYGYIGISELPLMCQSINTMTYTYIATCFHSLTLPNAIGECRMNRLKGLCHDLRGYQVKRIFLFWIRNPKSKRNQVEEILDNLLFS